MYTHIRTHESNTYTNIQEHPAAQIAVSALCCAMRGKRGAVPATAAPVSGSTIRNSSSNDSYSVALCRVVKKESADPYLAVLFPKELSGIPDRGCDESLLMYRLPCR